MQRGIENRKVERERVTDGEEEERKKERERERKGALNMI